MRDKRTIALAFLALLLGVGLWILRTPRERRNEGARAAPRETVTSPDAPARAPLVAPVPAGELAPERAPIAVETQGSAADPAAPPRAGESLLLELVLAESGAPAVLADVWYRDAAPGEELDTGDLEGKHLVGAGLDLGSVGGFHQEAEKLRADERGLVRLPLVSGRSLQVLAELEAHAGMKTFAFEPGVELRSRMELVRDWELRVQVLQAGGEPAAKIAVFLQARSGGSSWMTSERTGADGIARFAHAGLRAVEHPGASWSTGLSLPLTEVLERELDPARPLAEPVVFRLPPLGEVEVLVLGVDGKPVADGTDVQLGLVAPGQPRDLSPFAHGERQYAYETTLAGKALFRSVEPGYEVELRAGSNAWQPFASGFFPGPARARERVQHTLRAELDHPVLVFRAVDEQAQPLRETELELGQWTHSGWNTSWDEQEARTDADGVFRVDLRAGWKEGDEHRLHVTARAGAIGAALDLARPFENGLHPMGDLALCEAPLLAEGRVLDEGGAGVAGVEIELQASGDGESWSDVDLETKSGSEGEFTARGFVFGERLRLEPRQEGKAGPAVECEVGARGIELRLVATGAVAGAVLLDPGIPADQVHLRLVPEGAGEDERDHDWRAQTEPEPSGEFRIDDQLPGRYALEVFLEDELHVLEVPGIVVTAGLTTRDPRLEPIDLRRRLFVTRLRFLLPEADAGLEGTLGYQPSDGGQRERWHYFRGNPAELVTPHPSLDLSITVRGYRGVRLTDVSGEREVVLARALRVRLVLPSAVALPAPPRYLKATLVAGEDGHANIDWGASAFDESRASVSQAGGTGRMRVQWILEQRANGGASASTFDVEPVQWVEVLESSEEQTFALEITQAALDEALAQASF